MEGLSLRELSEAIDKVVSHAALAKYEKGLMMPDTTLLARLCRVLHQNPGFFLRRQTLKFGPIRFRKMARLSAAHEAALCDGALDYFERYAEIEQTLGMDQSFENPLEGKLVQSFEDAENRAVELRKAWKLGNDPIPNVISMLESKGIKIQVARTEDRHIDGLCSMTAVGPVMVLASWLDGNPLRKRMTTIHEFGHLLLELPKGISEKEEESLISRFAGAFLLPADSFRKQFGGHRTAITLEELIQLKLFYGVSIMAMMMRARHLDLIPEAVYRRFWTEHGNEWKQKQGEPGDELCLAKEEPVRFKMLVYRAAAEQRVSLSKGAELLGVTLGEFRKELGKVCS
jgi:Zn-dependent peptidase ImmA (M78 family)